ncbi:PD-(D/E)XK motif protein [Delftia tsuruhatensis]|uniref:PD-(D/E)XK motif protein n=1 Tax=Delftia tsuruhatensis TaxID=180282 RepID=UPI0020903554|nr:PD-(D/E)XK motif protein [Delftia tsuruhatensis]MCO5335736.1 PD-(D/E)XK motif protein [Delftia tsuruhatensis]MCR4544295.1 PD-(D/E)XK motif protein [Delftia tsuruhatensis]
MVEITQARWASLREQRLPHEDIYEQAAEDLEAALIGVSVEGRLHLLLAIDVAPQNLPPDLQSLQVRILEGGQTWLDVSARSHHEELLTLVANKVLYAIRIEGRDPAISVERIIDEMRAALRPLAPDLSTAEQIGLFGELWVLSNVLLPTLGPRVSHLWSGPESERHDFVGQGVHIEVKTTTRSEPKHEISRLDQLKAPANKRLLFVSVMLERSLGGDETLADRVDEIREKLESDGHALDVFDSRLTQLGWHEGLRQTGALLRFTFRDVHVFEVAGNFPRLPDDYMPPPSVTGIKYSINVGSLPSLDVSEVREVLLTA